MNVPDTKILNVFIVESRFQALVALLIARSALNSENLVFYYAEETGNFINKFPFVHSHYLGPKISSGPWKRPRKLLRMVNLIEKTVAQYEGKVESVNVFVANLKTHLLNYSVNRLRKTVNWTPISFNIITDGTFNFKRYPMPADYPAKMAKIARKLPYRLPGLDFYIYSGDLQGIEDPLIHQIYLLPHSPHEYNAEHIVDVPIVDLGLTVQHNASNKPRALVIGERLFAKEYLTEAEENDVNQIIADLLTARDISDVDFVKHPNAPTNAVPQPWYTLIDTQDPVEIRLMEQHYDVVIASVSTALMTARMLCPTTTEVISVGLERCAGRKKTIREVEKAFRGLGVILI